MAELWNEWVYTDVMQSDGFVVDYAVLTTYGLDMTSLLSVPFALGTMSDLTEAAMRSPHLVLDAVNKSADKFVVFCNAGSIAVPQAYSKIYALLDRNVVQIALPKRGHGFVNFHPKVWVIKETNPDTEESQIKVVVLSRNLTCSEDLDVVCELVGRISPKPSTKRAQEKHRPLADFLRWLSDRSAVKIQKKIGGIIKDLEHVEQLELINSPFKAYDFFPMGIDGYDGGECLQSEMLEDAAEMVVISPFVDFNTLDEMTRCRPKARKTLITRHASVTNEVLQLFNDGVYVPKEVLMDKTEKDVTVNLHEKVYFIHNARAGRNTLYLGSTNATQNGFGRNVEFLLRLEFEPHKTSYNIFRGELIHDGKDCIFEQVAAVPADNALQENPSNELVLREAIAAIQKAEVLTHRRGYTVTVRCKKPLPKEDVIIFPLGCEAIKRRLADGVTFEKLEASMLTEFYVLSVGDIKRVVKISTTGMPTEERERAIFRSIIDTKSKFLSYLEFMLSNDVEQYILESQQMESESSAGASTATDEVLSISLYEDLVRTAYTDPDRIKNIRAIIDKVDASVIPEHFEDLYDSLVKAMPHLKTAKKQNCRL